MVLFPHAKINLGLHVLRKREDGYHDIETIFYPLPWQDVLEVQEGPSQLESYGLKPDGEPEDNLVWKAWSLLRKDFDLPELSWRLLKNIPFGAGLGGGSADGAFMLMWLNEHYQLGLRMEALSEYALQLGSDCPFFLHGKPMLGSGRGEHLTPIDVNLAETHAVVIYPGFTISTAWAFGEVTPTKPEKPLPEIIQQPRTEWQGHLTNDFEGPIFKRYPRLAEIKQWLYDQGAFYTAMSGSGSAVFGLFEQEKLDRYAVAGNFGLEPNLVWAGYLP